MAKINKVYPPFHNGVSQQNPELILDNQCKAMENCIPDIVRGLKKRPPVTFVTNGTYEDIPHYQNASIFHTYDRGEDNEEYLFMDTKDPADPIEIYNKNGEKMVVEYNTENISACKSYLSNSNLKGLTVQDRTWVVSKDALIDIDYSETVAPDPDYKKTAYYWIKRSSGDRYNPYNYAVYLDGVTYACNPNKPSGATEDPPTGFEDSDYAANYLQGLINGATPASAVYQESFAQSETRTLNYNIGKNLTLSSPAVEVYAQDSGDLDPFIGVDLDVGAYTYDSNTGEFEITITNNTALLLLGQPTSPLPLDIEIKVNFTSSIKYTCKRDGSLLQIYRADGGDFGFSSWDSWGNQASEGWKGSVNKITDLPKNIGFSGVYVEITGDESNTFTNYYVKWNGSSWEECGDPMLNRGKLTNMPIKIDRTALVDGVATFTVDLIEWTEPRVGNLENNPDPSFAPNEDGFKYGIKDIFFYKNRLGFVTADSVILSETANYTNFYASTALDVLSTDMIDITVASNQASKIYYAKPFNNSLYIFTGTSQYELVADGAFTPTNVALNNTTNYPMATDVEPVVVNDSLYFISTTENRQQLREYIKTEKLNVKGIDLNVSTPTYLEKPIKKLIANGVLGYVLCCTADNEIYFYNFKEDGNTRIQSAWNKWTLLNGLATNIGSWEYWLLGSTLTISLKTPYDYKYHKMQLDTIVEELRTVDTTTDLAQNTLELPYTSKVTLPDYYPQLTGIRTPKDKMLIKKVTIEGEGNFDAEIYRKDYNKTYLKKHTASLRDLDLHVSSKVGKCDITILDNTDNDFSITSVVVEGLFSTTSKELK